MTSRSEIVALARSGISFEELGRHLGMPPGRAYLVAVGHPADDSDAGSDRQSYQTGITKQSSTQSLCNPPSDSVYSQPAVHRWVKERAHRDQLKPPVREDQGRREPRT